MTITKFSNLMFSPRCRRRPPSSAVPPAPSFFCGAAGAHLPPRSRQRPPSSTVPPAPTFLHGAAGVGTKVAARDGRNPVDEAALPRLQTTAAASQHPRPHPWSCHPGGGGLPAACRGRSRPRTTAAASQRLPPRPWSYHHPASSCESSGEWGGLD